MVRLVAQALACVGVTCAGLACMIATAQTPTRSTNTGATARETPADYTLGPDDQVVVRVENADEITQTPIRIDPRGNINLPMVGRLHVAGLTTEQLESFLTERLKKYLQDPEVFVYLTELRSQPISVLGAVNSPGVHQLEGHKTLFEVLSLAGGLRQDAGYSVKITRRKQWGTIPLSGAKEVPSAQFYTASVNVKTIMDATKPEDNIEIKPDDVISVPKADIVYVIGAVRKSGGFVLGENEHLSALQVLSLAEGFEQFADKSHAKIMRPTPGSSDRTEIPVDLKTLMAGKGTDVPLKADDILFIPTSGRKAAAVRGIEAALGMGTSITTGLVIYRR